MTSKIELIVVDLSMEMDNMEMDDVFSPLARGAVFQCGTSPGWSQSCAATSTIQSNKVSRLCYKIARIMNKKKCDNKQGSCEKKIQHVNSKQRLDGICRKLTMLALCLVVQC